MEECSKGAMTGLSAIFRTVYMPFLVYPYIVYSVFT
jgi:hypothetical protein